MKSAKDGSSLTSSVETLVPKTIIPKEKMVILVSIFFPHASRIETKNMSKLCFSQH